MAITSSPRPVLTTIRPEWMTVIDPALQKELEQYVFTTTWQKLISTGGIIDTVYNWGRRSSLWPLGFGLACCAIEMICTASSRFDIARFGAEVFRGSPRQADVMIVSGTVTKTMMPTIARLYDQMPEPKYVISDGGVRQRGAARSRKGTTSSRAIDKFLPVDVYVPGCPPSPQALLQWDHHASEADRQREDHRGRRGIAARLSVDVEIPVPVLGPDLIDLRLARDHRREDAAAGLGEAHEAGLEKPPIISAPVPPSDEPSTRTRAGRGRQGVRNPEAPRKRGQTVEIQPRRRVWIGHAGLAERFEDRINHELGAGSASIDRVLPCSSPPRSWLAVAADLARQESDQVRLPRQPAPPSIMRRLRSR